MNQNFEKNLGQIISLRRKELKLSQAALAEKLNMSRSHIGKIELGDSLPPLKTLISLNEVLGVNLLDTNILHFDKLGVTDSDYCNIVTQQLKNIELTEHAKPSPNKQSQENIIHFSGGKVSITIDLTEPKQPRTIKISID